MKSIFKKASTLAELVVCMALTAILSTAIVSFCLTINVNVARHQATNDFTDDLAIVKQYVNEWVSHFDDATYAVTVSDDKSAITAKNGDTVVGQLSSQTVTEDGESRLKLTSQLVGANRSRAMLNITGITFEVQGALVKCNITYTVVGGNNVDNHKTLTFVVARRVVGGSL